MVETLYLGLNHGGPGIPCTITHGCEDVLSSVYSEVGGIPISWFGFVFYFTVFAVAVFTVFGTASLRWLSIPSAFAFAVSAVLTGVQGWVLEAWCQYCLASALLSTGIAALVWTAPRGDDSVDSTEKA